MSEANEVGVFVMVSGSESRARRVGFLVAGAFLMASLAGCAVSLAFLRAAWDGTFACEPSESPYGWRLPFLVASWARKDYLRAAVTGLLSIAYAIASIRLLRTVRRLARQSAELGPLCEECGYSLRGLMDPRCPECGTAFQRMREQAGAIGIGWRAPP